jgi:hypothetical protein
MKQKRTAAKAGLSPKHMTTEQLVDNESLEDGLTDASSGADASGLRPGNSQCRHITFSNFLFD